MIKKFKLLKGENLLPFIANTLFAIACFAMLFRFGVKYDTGDGYREVILMLIGTTALVPFFIKTRKCYFEYLLLFLSGILIVISFLVSDIQSYGIAEVFGFFAVLNTIFIVSQIGSEKLDILKWGLILLAAVVSGYGLMKFTYQTEPRVISRLFNPLNPEQGFPNAVALLLLILWPYAAHKMVNSKLHINKVVGGMIFALSIAALYLTYSRGALIAFGIQIILLGIFNYKHFWKNKVKWIAGVILAVMIVIGTLQIRTSANLTTSDIGEKIALQNNENITSIDERLDFFKLTSLLILEKPLLGHGPQSFRFVYPSKQELLYGNSSHPHNIFLKYGLESGIICALLLLGVFVSLGIKSFKTIGENVAGGIGVEKDFMAIAVAGGLAHNMVDYNLNFLLIYVIFAITIGILMSLLDRGNAARKSATCKLCERMFFVIFFCLTFSIAVVGVRDYMKTDPYSDAETIRRYTSREVETHIANYSQSFYLREFWIQLSDYYVLRSDMENGLEMIDKHLAINPHDIYGYINKGRILYNLKRYDEALDAFEKAIEVDSKNSLLVHYYYLGTLEKLSEEPSDGYLKLMLYPILEEFMFYAENNIHYCAARPELEAAQKIFKLLKNSGDQTMDYTSLSNELDSFATKYRDGNIKYEIKF